MNREKSNDAVTGSPSVKEATAGSTANKALKVVAGVLTAFVAVVVMIGCVLVVVPNAWRAYSALSGAGSTGGGSVEYLIAKARPGSVLLVRDPGDGAADELDVSGFDDIGVEPGDLVSVRDEGGEAMTVQLTDPGRIVGADSWALVEKGAADSAASRCASRYPWFGGGVDFGEPLVARVGWSADGGSRSRVLTGAGQVGEALSDMSYIVDGVGGIVPRGDEWACADALGRFDGAFFDGHDLVCAYVSLGSGSARFDVLSVGYGGGRYSVAVGARPLPPSAAATADMAGWLALVPVPKQEAPADGFSVSVDIVG